MKYLVLVAITVFSFNVFAADKKPKKAAVNCANDSTYKQISKAELEKLVSQRAQDNVVVIDVNSKASYAKSHIPKAVHYAANKDKFAKILPKKKDALIVAYCGGPSCGAWKTAAKKACELGYTNVKHYKGGIKGWLEKAS